MTIREIKSRKHKGEMPQVKTIAEELDLSASAVQRHLRQFADDGLIEFLGSDSHRKYRLVRKSER